MCVGARVPHEQNENEKKAHTSLNWILCWNCVSNSSMMKRFKVADYSIAFCKIDRNLFTVYFDMILQENFVIELGLYIVWVCVCVPYSTLIEREKKGEKNENKNVWQNRAARERI